MRPKTLWKASSRALKHARRFVPGFSSGTHTVDTPSAGCRALDAKRWMPIMCTGSSVTQHSGSEFCRHRRLATRSSPTREHRGSSHESWPVTHKALPYRPIKVCPASVIRLLAIAITLRSPAEALKVICSRRSERFRGERSVQEDPERFAAISYWRSPQARQRIVDPKRFQHTAT